MIVLRGRHLLETPFAHIASPDILVDEDIAVVHESPVGSQAAAEGRVTIGPRRIGRPFHEEGVGAGVVFWRVNDGIQSLAVAHGYVYFLFVEVVLDIVRFGGAASL